MFTRYTICSVGGSTEDAKRPHSFYFTFNYSTEGRKNVISSKEIEIIAAITATCTTFFCIIALLLAHLCSCVCGCVSSSRVSQLKVQWCYRMHKILSSYHQSSRVPSSTLISGYHLCALPYLLVSLCISTKVSNFKQKPYRWHHSCGENFHLVDPPWL